MTYNKKYKKKKKIKVEQDIINDEFDDFINMLNKELATKNKVIKIKKRKR